MNIYTLFAMDEEDGWRYVGDFNHEIVGVYESFADARDVADQHSNREALLIMRSVLGGTSFSSEEVWRKDPWKIVQD